MGLRAPKELKNAQSLENEYPISKLLPYKYHYDKNTVVTQDNRLLRVFEVKGVCFETASDELINKWHRQFHQFFMQNATMDVAFWTHLIKETDEERTPEKKLTSTFSKILDESYRKKIKNEKFYRFKLFITVVINPESFGLPFLGTNFSKRNASLEAINEQLDTISHQLVRLDHEPRLLGLYERNDQMYSETYSFLSRLISGSWREIPVTNRPANELIATSRITTGKETLEYRTATDTFYSAAFGFKDYPSGSNPLMLSEVLSLPFPFILAQSFVPIDQLAAVKQTKRARNILKMTEEDDRAQVEDLDDLLADISARRVMLGEHNLSFFIFTDPDISILPDENESKKIRTQLKNRVSMAVHALSGMNCHVTREDIALNAQLFAMMPGNFKYRPRITPISSGNFCAFFPMHSVPTGDWEQKYWGDSVSSFKTRANTLYDFSFHAGATDLGHTLVFGSSGAGKTTLQAFLLSQAEKLNAKTIYFDYKRGCETFIRACGGTYLKLQKGEPSQLNPYCLEPTKQNLDFLTTFTLALAYPNLDAPPKIENEVAAVISLALSDEKKSQNLRNLTQVYQYFQNEDLRERLFKWTTKGQHGWLFDNEEDNLRFDKQFIGIDATQILEDPILTAPAFFYLTYRTKELYGQRFFLSFEELWKMLDHPITTPWIKDELKVVRKMNGVFIGSTQDTNDVAESPLASTLRGQCPTRIFFPNYEADIDVYKTFKVTDIEFSWIKEADIKWREFLLKQGTESAILSIDLDGLDKELAVISGRESNLAIMEACIAETSDNPDDWLPLYFKRYSEE